MSKSNVQMEVESFLRGESEKKKLPLCWGGVFECDAVSKDGKTVICISTSKAKTSGGKRATGKINKILGDALYLLHLKGKKKKVLLFTDKSMHDQFKRMQAAGRFTPNIVIALQALPVRIQRRLNQARLRASREVSGG